MPERLLSSIAHVELLTPDLDTSVDYARDILGLDVVDRVGDSAYLRCWGDYYLYSLVLTAAPAPGLGHASWRAEGPEQMAEAVRRIEAAGTREAGSTESFGHGRGVPVHRPGRSRAGDLLGGGACGRARRRGVDLSGASAARAIARTRRTDPRSRHRDQPRRRAFANWTAETLGSRVMAAVEPAPGAPWVFCVITNNEKSHDWGSIQDFEGQAGPDAPRRLLGRDQPRSDAGREVHRRAWPRSNQGPGQHGIGEQNYLYFRDPVGLRYELNSGGYRNYVPDWEPVIWRPEQGSNNVYRTEIGMPAVRPGQHPAGSRRQQCRRDGHVGRHRRGGAGPILNGGRRRGRRA